MARGATTRGGKGEEGGEGGRESEVVREEKNRYDEHERSAEALRAMSMCLFSISINNVERVDEMHMGGRR